MTIRPATDPYWVQGSLDSHWLKHPVEMHGGCSYWGSLSLSGSTSKEEYKRYSINVPRTCWLVFAATQLKPQSQPRGRHHVDDNLVKTITDLESVPRKPSDGKISTCYHDHSHSGGSCSAPDPDVNVRRLRHLVHLSKRLSFGDFEDFELGNPSRTPPKQIQQQLKAMVEKHV
jgi:hypothetical protein